MADLMRKKFDQELHDKSDIPARIKAKTIIADLGYIAIDNPNKHGVDLIVYDSDDEHVCNVECEIKNSWVGDSFKFPNVNMLERKTKFCNLNRSTYFMLFNKDLSNYLVIKDKDLIVSPLEIVA